MEIYARIQNGLVAEFFETSENIADMFHPDLIWVDVTTVTPTPQLGWRAQESDGSWTFSAPVVPAPTPAQQALAALAAGLSIVSTGTPALNGTYSCDSLSQADIVAIETSISAGKGFPGGATTFNYQDTSGAMHAFSQSDFTNLAAAIRDYVYAVRSAGAGVSTTFPVPTATIA